MNSLNIQKIDDTLHEAANRFLGGWRNALQTVGIDPDELTRQVYNKRYHYPDKQSVIKGIENRHKKGWWLCYNALFGQRKQKHRDAALARRGVELFGAWGKALRAAGMDPVTVQKPGSKKRKYPSAEKVLREIRARTRRKWAINSRALYIGSHPDVSLVESGYAYYGSWKATLRTAGIDHGELHPDMKHCRRQYPSKEAIILGIKGRLKEGLSVSPPSLRRKRGEIRSNVGLYFYGIEYFGSWENALKSAGVDPETIHQALKPKRKYATKQDVIHEIRARNKRKWAINHSDMYHGTNQDSSLGHWAPRYFGSWQKALRAAGFDPAKIYRQAQLRHLKYPDEKAVLKAINQRVKEKRSLNYWGVAFGENRDFPLVLRASRFFGSWNNALKKAGLDPKKIKHDVLSRAARKRCRKKANLHI